MRFDDLRVLRTTSVDFGDGKVVDGGVQPWACGAPGVPNPYVLTVPTHTYRAAGTYTVTVSATTAVCSLEDNDLGPDEPAEVRPNIVVP
jgi:PKD repeat protein